MLFKVASVLFTLAASALFVQAAPLGRGGRPLPRYPFPAPPRPAPGPPRPVIPRYAPECPVSTSTIDFPANSTIGIPPGQKVVHIVVGRGVQNYTCTNGTFASAGAVATLYDISCLQYFPPAFNSIQDVFLALPKTNPTSDTQGALKKFGAALVNPILTQLENAVYMGDHFFSKIDGKLVPVFDMQKRFGPGQFVNLSKKGSIPDPVDPTKNVAWLELVNVTGDLASETFRVHTAGGVAPTSCTTEGQAISVDYAAKYYFTKPSA